jgi:bifunctional aspartokinase / homoserine dehydrogenase 1
MQVIHPKTMNPVVHLGIPIWIRNTFAPHDGGTCIGPPELARHVLGSTPTGTKHLKDVVRGFSNIDGLALFNLEGSGLLGVVGAASKLFASLQRVAVNVVLIAQASSEHSICLATPASQAEVAKAAISEAFFREIHLGDVDPITYVSPVSIVAAVGDNMSHMPGVSGRFFSAFAKAKVNVVAVSQGSSERNISAVVATQDAAAALRAVHNAFMSTVKVVSVGLLVSSDDVLVSTFSARFSELVGTRTFFQWWPWYHNLVSCSSLVLTW